jgi:probable rRNA maturation factor
MKIYLEDEVNFFEDNQTLLQQVEQVVRACAAEEKMPYEFEVSLTVVDEEGICEINRDYREIDKVTDVLSFPQIEFGEAFTWDKLEKVGYENPDTGCIVLGDIVLCSAVARKQALSYGHSLEREVCFLVAHSMFHLLGYDHETEEEERVMIQKQEKILQGLNMRR